MTPQELAEEIATTISDAGQRVLNEGAQQYYQLGKPQKFETMTLDGLARYYEEEVLDLIDYGVMTMIRRRRLREAAAAADRFERFFGPTYPDPDRRHTIRALMEIESLRTDRRREVGTDDDDNRALTDWLRMTEDRVSELRQVLSDNTTSAPEKRQRARAIELRIAAEAVAHIEQIDRKARDRHGTIKPGDPGSGMRFVQWATIPQGIALGVDPATGPESAALLDSRDPVQQPNNTDEQQWQACAYWMAELASAWSSVNEAAADMIETFREAAEQIDLSDIERAANVIRRMAKPL